MWHLERNTGVTHAGCKVLLTCSERVCPRAGRTHQAVLCEQAQVAAVHAPILQVPVQDAHG